MSKEEIALLKRALERQVKSRKQAEKILEEKSKELYDIQHYLKEDNNRLRGLLKEKTTELEGVFFNIPDPYLVINLDGKVIKMNAAAKNFLGYNIDREDFYAAQLVHHEYLLETLNSFKVLQDVGVLKNFRTKINLKSGKESYIQLNASMIYNAEGSPIAAQGVLRDVTNEQEVASILETQKVALEDSQNRLATVISNLQFGVLLEDENRKIALTNPIFCEMFGMQATPEQLVGVDCSGAADQSKLFFKDPDGFVSRIAQLLKDKKAVIADELLTVSGQVLHRDFIPIFNGAVYKGHLWVYTDVTIRKKYKDNLQAQKEKYSSIIANMNLGLVEVDNEDRVQLVNNSFCVLSGYTEKELMGQKLANLLKVSDPNIIPSHQKKRLKGVSDTYEVNVTIKGGTQSHWLISGAPRYNIKGEVVGSIGIHLDITKQHELATQKEVLLQELALSNTSLQEYAHVVSHDLKSPLRSISALASWLGEDYGDALGTEGMAQLGLMQGKISVMDNLITGILKYSSIGFDKKAYSLFDTKELVEEIQTTIYWPSHISLIFKSSMPRINADRTQIQQLFQNLLSNAVEHIEKPKGEIVIWSEETTDYWSFSVSDNGVGIKKEYHHKIFDIFQSMGDSPTATGIGLSIVKRVVQNHKGVISLKSKLGVGSTFSFTIKKHIS